jgi:FSR family fosmidomycin resistance protein-like MFS transporter
MGTSLHQTGGKIGFAIGPLLITSVVMWRGLEGSYVLVVLGIVLSALLALGLRGKARPRGAAGSPANLWKTINARRTTLLLLAGLTTLRATSMVGITVFYPTYVTGRGAPLLFAGIAMTVYEVVGSSGTLLGGAFSDRFGRRRVLLLAQLVSGPLLFLAITWPEGLVGLLLLGVAGAVASSASPVELTLFQELIPGGRSTAAGIWYLLSFEGSVVSALAVGLVADQIGLGATLQISVFAYMLATPLTWALPSNPPGSRDA